MAPALLHRNVRPRPTHGSFDSPVEDDNSSAQESEDHEPRRSGVNSKYDSDSDESVDDSKDSEGDMQEYDEDENEDGDGPQDSRVEQQINHVSFGALKQAQDALSRKRKREPETAVDQEEKLAALRERLQQIKRNRHARPAESEADRPSRSRHPRDEREIGVRNDAGSEESDSDSPPSEEGGTSRSRSSKHAPAAQSSKYQVSRKRIVIDVPKRQFRDPRFDAIQQQRSGHSGDSEKAYGFLREYQKAEIEELRTAIKRTKNEEEKEKLRRTAGSMENRIKAREAKERTQEVIRQHRREERAKVEQGKNPYYLKNKEIKERALVEKFKGMKSKDREKLMERRQRKESQKEKKRMPNARRMG